MRFVCAFLSILFALLHCAKSEIPAPRKTQKPQMQGEDIVRTTCVTCHSKRLIDHASKSRLDWEKTLTKMQQQGMPPIPKAFLAPLLDYLVREHGPRKREDRENRGPWGDVRNANPLW